MRRGALFWIFVIASSCGTDSAHQPDAPPAGTPRVVVTGPRMNEGFYMTQTADVLWSVTDESATLVCDVMASDGATMIPIALDIVAPSGAATMTPWTLTAVAPSTTYVAQVTCSDDSSPPLTGTGASGMFAVAGPPQQVSYASQVQPIWTGKCVTTACHDNVTPQARLNLTPAVSHAALVGIASQQCPSKQLVNPGEPGQSYVMIKLEGSGPCMTGSRMPKTSPALPAAQLQIIRDWIVTGAPNN